MTKAKYNNIAAALSFEYNNSEQDIDNWKLVYDGKEWNGNGNNELMIALAELPKDLVNYVYVKNLDLFELIGENWFNYSKEKDSYLFNSKSGIHTYFLTCNNIQFRNWDEIIPETEDPWDFLEKFEWLRKTFQGRRKNLPRLQNHFKYTLANELWKYIKNKWYLDVRSDTVYKYSEEVLLSDIKLIEMMNETNKGGLLLINPLYYNKEIRNVYSFDSSSNHISLMARKKFPKKFRKVELDEYKEVLDSDNLAWIGRFVFKNINIKKKIFYELKSFGFFDRETQTWNLTLTNVDWEWLKDYLEIGEKYCTNLYAAEQDYLPTKLVDVIDWLYKLKSQFEKGSYERTIAKKMAEMPYGQSIKTPFYEESTEIDTDNILVKTKNNEPSLEEIQQKLLRNGIPFQVGIWTVAYSRLQLIRLIELIGEKDFVYCDTDCIKFKGKENIKKIEEWNSLIDKEFEEIEESTGFEINQNLGRWLNDGKYEKFKVIAPKWYLYIEEGKLDITASGANHDNLLKFLHSLKSDKVFEFFDPKMSIAREHKIFKCVRTNRIDRTAFTYWGGYNDYHDYEPEERRQRIEISINAYKKLIQEVK